jgi:hypothetical protein
VLYFDVILQILAIFRTPNQAQEGRQLWLWFDVNSQRAVNHDLRGYFKYQPNPEAILPPHFSHERKEIAAQAGTGRDKGTAQEMKTQKQPKIQATVLFVDFKLPSTGSHVRDVTR